MNEKDCTNMLLEVTAKCYLGKESLEPQASFCDRENLCTIVEPRCGGCRCGKCPIPGSRYSHKEEGELKKIRDNLVRRLPTLSSTPGSYSEVPTNQV